MSPEQALEAIGRGMMQALLGAQKPVATRRRGSSSSPARAESSPGAAAGATPAAPPPLQQSMFEPPNAGLPSIEELDKILNISRPTPTNDPPGTYRPDTAEVKPWLAN